MGKFIDKPETLLAFYSQVSPTFDALQTVREACESASVSLATGCRQDRQRPESSDGMGSCCRCKSALRLAFPLRLPPTASVSRPIQAPPTHKIPLGWDAENPRGAEILLFWPGARAT